jgi:hypothetical protein
VDELSIVDVAPLLLHQLGLPAPEDMAGSVPETIFEPGELERRPVRRVPAALVAPVSSDAATVELDPGEQVAVMERLRALGYVE